MKLKKLLAALCACAMVFALAVPAFAATAGNIDNETSTKFEGSTLPDDYTTVSVSVLTGVTKLYVNPYGLPYSITDGTIMKPNPDFDPNSPEDPDTNPSMIPSDEKIKEGITTAGWFSNTAAIKNESDEDLKVGVTMKTELKSNTVTVVETDPGTNPVTINTLWGNLQLAPATMSTTKVIEGDWDGNDVKEVTIPAASTTMTTDYDHGFILSGATEGEDNLGQPILVPAYATFRLRGDAKMVEGSSTGGNASNWGLNDLADVTVAFSFKPDTP